jgi:hypothetical protein
MERTHIDGPGKPRDPLGSEASLVVKGFFAGVGAREVEAPCRGGGAGRSVVVGSGK